MKNILKTALLAGTFLLSVSACNGGGKNLGKEIDAQQFASKIADVLEQREYNQPSHIKYSLSLTNSVSGLETSLPSINASIDKDCDAQGEWLKNLTEDETMILASIDEFTMEDVAGIYAAYSPKFYFDEANSTYGCKVDFKQDATTAGVTMSVSLVSTVQWDKCGILIFIDEAHKTTLSGNGQTASLSITTHLEGSMTYRPLVK